MIKFSVQVVGERHKQSLKGAQFYGTNKHTHTLTQMYLCIFLYIFEPMWWRKLNGKLAFPVIFLDPYKLIDIGKVYDFAVSIFHIFFSPFSHIIALPLGCELLFVWLFMFHLFSCALPITSVASLWLFPYWDDENDENEITEFSHSHCVGVCVPFMSHRKKNHTHTHIYVLKAISYPLWWVWRKKSFSSYGIHCHASLRYAENMICDDKLLSLMTSEKWTQSVSGKNCHQRTYTHIVWILYWVNRRGSEEEEKNCGTSCKDY